MRNHKDPRFDLRDPRDPDKRINQGMLVFVAALCVGTLLYVVWQIAAAPGIHWEWVMGAFCLMGLFLLIVAEMWNE